MASINLNWKLINDIEGNFLVPSYQRGYRWTELEVQRLLDDIYNLSNLADSKRNYCLQPVVVKNNGDKFELIDGQQRLTTIYLIRNYLYKKVPQFFQAPKFSIDYKTRSKSKDFLENIDMSRRSEYIDFYFMANAYETIEKWFADKVPAAMTDIDNYFTKFVKIIWYEVDESEDAVALFTRLNIGKIALTSAELVKAMFLSRDNGSIDANRQEEIALQWDSIERELHNDKLWYFLTNNAASEYQTRIDLVLDLMSQKTVNEKEEYFTFFDFDNRNKGEGKYVGKRQDLKDIWADIVHTFLILKDWFEDHELYHKVGYLIASKSKTLLQIYISSQNKTKTAFIELLNDYIKDSVDLTKISSKSQATNYSELSYGSDDAMIRRLLMLFNVESVRINGAQTQWFPFDKFKFYGKNKVLWSLEHIHAQQSEGLNKQELWRQWIELHLPSIKSLNSNNQDLINRIKSVLDQREIKKIEFDTLYQEIIEKLSDKDSAKYINSISNLALLNCDDNAALSNSTFDVKRNEIIRMDKEGKFIPFCTKMVFLKYYTPSSDNQLHFWGQSDREAYIKAINDVLYEKSRYLSEPIDLKAVD